jgi:hypothetical protein
VADSHPVSAQINFLLRVLFLLSYLLTRCLWFPIVVFSALLPDLISEIRSAKTATGAAPPVIAMLFILPLMFLQFHWGKLLIWQAIKALSPPVEGLPAPPKPTELV